MPIMLIKVMETCSKHNSINNWGFWLRSCRRGWPEPIYGRFSKIDIFIQQLYQNIYAYIREFTSASFHNFLPLWDHRGIWCVNVGLFRSSAPGKGECCLLCQWGPRFQWHHLFTNFIAQQMSFFRNPVWKLSAIPWKSGSAHPESKLDFLQLGWPWTSSVESGVLMSTFRTYLWRLYTSRSYQEFQFICCIHRKQ